MTTAVVLAVLAVLVAGCSNDSARIAELESQLAELQENASTTVPATTPPDEETSTTVQALSVSQQVYCDELTSVVKVRTPTGGLTNRPETVAFFEIAHRLGYLVLPYNPDDWGLGGADTPNEWLSGAYDHSYVFPATDAGDRVRGWWRLNLQGSGIDFNEAYRQVCLQAWELR